MLDLQEIQNREEKKENAVLPRLDYTEEEKEYLDSLLERLRHARDKRVQEWAELNDMDYETYYDTNKRAANAYIPPKKNKNDARVVTGTTKEKVHTMLSAILNYDLSPDVQAYDENDMKVDELGNDLEDLVKKSREQEVYEDKRPLIYKELLDQGTCFVEEIWKENFQLEKKFTSQDWESIDPQKIDWEERLRKVYEGPAVRLLEGVKVYLGNMNEFDISNQPYIFTVEHLPYEEAKDIYQNWERWQYVNKYPTDLAELEGEDVYNYNWTLTEPSEESVEVIKYQDKFRNEYMILCNGVMMLPPKFPLTAISPSGRYTIAKGDIDPVSNFFPYSKSIPADTKVDQEVLDEMMKLIVLKTRQSYRPPLANRSNRNITGDIFSAGTIVPGLDPNQLQPILPSQQGVNNAEFNAYEFIKRIIDQKSVSPAFSGQQTSGDQTATEVIQMKKQQMMKLGLTIWGVITLERQLSWLRLQNIKHKWTQPTEEKSDKSGRIKRFYRSFSIDTTLESGKKGIKIIDFDKKKAKNMSSEEVKQEEDLLSSPERPVRVIYYDPDYLRDMRAQFYIYINPTEKDTDEVRRAMYVQNIQDAAQIFGIRSLNMEYLKERFAHHAEEDPSKFFKQRRQAKPEESALDLDKEQLQRKQGVGGEVGKELTEGIRKQMMNPT